jgi:uncharacterized membrane protein
MADLLTLPAWAPNLHPAIVHFPIAWLIAAVVVDVISLMLRRTAWSATTATALYAGGAISAVVTYLSGRRAASAVLIPGMAQPIMVDHWNWATATTIYFGVLAAIRLAAIVRRRGVPVWLRATSAALGLGGLLLLFHTGEQGARLVYEHGVGVVPRSHSDNKPAAR